MSEGQVKALQAQIGKLANINKAQQHRLNSFSKVLEDHVNRVVILNSDVLALQENNGVLSQQLEEANKKVEELKAKLAETEKKLADTGVSEDAAVHDTAKESAA